MNGLPIFELLAQRVWLAVNIVNNICCVMQNGKNLVNKTSLI